jgi:cell division protein FtsQ
VRPSPARIWGRRLLAFGGVLVILAAIFLFWVRESSLFSVDKVEITGVTVNQAAVIGALQAEAGKMTTLHVRDEALRDAVSRFPTVGAIKVDANPPHDLKIEVIERKPVALAVSDGEKIPVSEEGYLLRGMPASSDLAQMELSQKVSGDRLLGADVDQATLLGALPADFREGVEGSRIDTEAGGVVVDLKNGIELRMGDGSDPAAKWAAAAAVLAEPDLGSPSYIDVSVPSRPVAGGSTG